MIRAGNTDLSVTSNRGGRCKGSGLASLHMKGTLASKSPVISGICLPLRGAVPPESARSQMAKHQKHRK